jgi:hypothetical protein
MRIPPRAAGAAVLTGVVLAASGPPAGAVPGRDPPAAPATRTVSPTPAPPRVITPAGRPAWRTVALAGAAVAGLVGLSALVAACRDGNRARRERR